MSDNHPPGGRSIGALIAFASLVVSVLAWLSPFNPVGPSPWRRVEKDRNEIAQQPADLDRKSPGDRRGEPSASASPHPNQEPSPTLLSSESSPTHEESRTGHPPGKERSSEELGSVIVLREGSPYTSTRLNNTVISVNFRETLGSRYAEFVIAPLGMPLIRFPARRAGTSEQFSIGDSVYEMQVMSLDLDSLTAQVVVNSTTR